MLTKFGCIGLLKKTILPSIFSLPSLTSSSKLLTSTTFDLIPTEGVATDPPNAHTSTSKVIPGCVSIKANSLGPLTHFGTITSCNHTLSKPIFNNSFLPHSTALSAPNEPDNLGPISLER